MIFPLIQLVVLGYAFGGKIKGAAIAVVDDDHSVESVRVRESSTPSPPARKPSALSTILPFPRAVDDLRAGFVRAVVQIPP